MGRKFNIFQRCVVSGNGFFFLLALSELQVDYNPSLFLESPAH